MRMPGSVAHKRDQCDACNPDASPPPHKWKIYVFEEKMTQQTTKVIMHKYKLQYSFFNSAVPYCDKFSNFTLFWHRKVGNFVPST